MLATSSGTVRNVVIGLLLVFLIALAVWALCTYVAKRPDLGGVGAALVAIIGGILVLLDNT